MIRRIVILDVALAALLVAGTMGCSRTRGTESPAPLAGPPILLFGVDGLEWDVVLPLIHEGRMPTIARLMERGSSGRISTMSPTSSPIIWTSIATGKIAQKHGILGFAYGLNGIDGDLQLYTSTDRRTKAFWDILSDYKRTVGTIGWWMTFPVEPINGIMVAQTNTLPESGINRTVTIMKGMLMRGVDGQVYPAERQDEMIELLEQSDAALPELTRRIFGEFKHPHTELTSRLWQNSQWAFRADATYLSIAERIIETADRPELMAVYMGGPDVVGHRYWRYRQPQKYQHPPTREEIEDYGRIIDDYYVYVDQSLDRLLRAYGTEVTVIVVSDHGMGPINLDKTYDSDGPSKEVLSGGHPKEVEPPGVIIACGPRIRKTPLRKPLSDLQIEDLPFLCSVLDVTPTLLTLMGIPVGRDMDGLASTHIVESDWLDEHKVEAVATHDTKEWRASRRAAALRSPHEAERLEQLRALGYIADDEEASEEQEKK
ncbi:MAG: alkaline phosphatase family protein [bacterium]|nr:alkaline phosphatase family protein [bacterium]